MTLFEKSSSEDSKRVAASFSLRADVCSSSQSGSSSESDDMIFYLGCEFLRRVGRALRSLSARYEIALGFYVAPTSLIARDCRLSTEAPSGNQP